MAASASPASASPALRLPTGEQLRRDYRATLKQAARLLDARAKRGLACARFISAQRDAMLINLFNAAHHAHPTPHGTPPQAIALAAQGGYGKGLCAPWSDMDLLFLLPAPPTRHAMQVIEAVLYPLWDAGFTIGHVVATPESEIAAAAQDAVRRTALLDLRFLAGAKPPFHRLQSLCQTPVSKKQTRLFVAAKLAERAQRHARAGGSRYMVEPDVKQGKGALRDLQSLDWISQFCYGAPALEALAARGMVSASERRRIRQCANLLWAVRCQLHFLAGKAEDRLSFARQQRIAEKLLPAKAGRSGVAAVEQFMKLYFRTANQVGDLTRILCALLEEEQAKAPALSRFIARAWAKKPAPGFLLAKGRLTFATLPPAAPIDVLRLFYESARHQVPLHPEAYAAARAHAKSFAPALRREGEAVKLFLDLLLQPGVEDALRRMREAGLLTAFMPEFGQIAGRMQFNMYHHYTADEHSLRAVGELAALRFKRRSAAGLDLLPALFRRLDKSQLQTLFLSMLCHDIAKGDESDHSAAGAKLAHRIARRCGLAPAACREVEFLVAHHLAMSQTAQRRDLADGKIVRDFAERMQTPARLSLLLLLTVADIRSVGPNVWNDWKGALLEELYRKALTLMRRPTADPPPNRLTRRRFAVAARLQHWPSSLRQRWLGLLPDNYWLQTKPERIASHAALWRQFREQDAPLLVSRRQIAKRAVSEITVLAHDHPGLFARLAAAFALSELDIAAAHLLTARDGIVLDRFFVQTASGGALIDAAHAKRLEKTMLDVLRGKTLPETSFARPGFQRRWRRLAPFPARPHITLDNETSAAHTLVEVNAPARPGLLAALAACFFRAGLLVDEARIDALGERAVDVFSVRDGAGQKLSPTRQQNLRRALLKLLEKPPPSAKPAKKAS